MQLILNNQVVNYVISGKGKKVLILHGWADSIASYTNLIKELSKKYEVIAVDLPGFGGSKLEQDNFNLNKYALFVRDFINKINSEDLHIVIGHSNGGSIAVKALSKNLIDSEKLVLIASAGIRNSESTKIKLRAMKIITKTAKLVSSPLPKSAKNKLRKGLYKNIGSDYLVREDLKNTFKNVVGEDIREDLKNINQDTLLIYADDDDQTPFTFGEEFHQILKSSTLEIVHGGGHFVIHSNPTMIADRIKEFDK